jgi:thymidylate synthase (FAD)
MLELVFMKPIRSSVTILTKLNKKKIFKHIELCGRICYKSENKINNDSFNNFIRNLISRKHESVIEHFSVSVKFICDRGVSHEIVRHRIASYSQESTRYCNYFNSGLVFVVPRKFSKNTHEYRIWFDSCMQCEKSYINMIKIGLTPESARSVLNNSLKTELIMTANLREWRHFLKLRTSKNAHPEIKILSLELLERFKNKLPIVFDDIKADSA